MTDRLFVTSADNRGTSDVPYGFVYFSDGSRVGFGDFPKGIGRYGLFAVASHWPDVTPGHFVLASEKLHVELPDFETPS